MQYAAMRVLLSTWKLLVGAAQKYCKDLDVLCAKGPPDVEEVLSNDFLSLRMTLIQDLFPNIEPLG